VLFRSMQLFHFVQFGHWTLWRGWNNRMTTQNQQNSNA